MSEPPNANLKLTALSLADAVKVITKTSGQNVIADDLRVHVSQGAPTNPDGTINLITYAAWLVAQ